MRNTILVLGTVTSLTFATPAFATGACSDFPRLDNCPIYGVYDNPTTHGPSYQMRRSKGSLTVRHQAHRPIRCAESPIKCLRSTLGMPEVTTLAIGPMDS